MTDIPKVTILLATFNRSHLILETLDSIFVQTYSNWECIIVDDHSTDSTKEIIEEYIKKDSRFSYYLKSEEYKKGLPGTRNYGLDIAKSRKAKFIQFFDDDDIMHPEKLAKQIEIFIRDLSIEIVNCKYQGFFGEFNLANHIYTGDMNVKTENLAEDFLYKKVRIHSIGPIFKASLLEEIRFDEELNYYAEEEEFYLRLFFLNSPKYYAVDDFLFFYRHHDKSITSSHDNNIQKIGTIIRMYQKLWDFLADKNLIKKCTLIFFLKYFLIYHYDDNYLNKISTHIKLTTEIGSLFKKKVFFILFCHRLYVKIISKILII